VARLGVIVAPGDNIREEAHAGKDWGHLIVLHLLLNVIQFILLFGFYPLTSRIGLKGDVHKTFFSAFGGLPGAIGIALAISFNSEVREHSEMFHTRFEFREQSNKVFGMHLSQCECICWVQLHFCIALLTLPVVLCCVFCESGLCGRCCATDIVCRSLAGPSLQKLGLADSTANRVRGSQKASTKLELVSVGWTFNSDKLC